MNSFTRSLACLSVLLLLTPLVSGASNERVYIVQDAVDTVRIFSPAQDVRQTIEELTG